MRFFSRRPTSTSSRRAASIGAVVAGSRTGSFKTDNGNDNDNNDILGQRGQGDRPPAVDGSPDEESLATKGGEGYRDIEGATVYGQAGKPGGEEGAVTPSAKVAMLEVEGMTCVVCVGIVENLLQRLVPPIIQYLMLYVYTYFRANNVGKVHTVYYFHFTFFVSFLRVCIRGATRYRSNTLIGSAQQIDFITHVQTTGTKFVCTVLQTTAIGAWVLFSLLFSFFLSFFI